MGFGNFTVVDNWCNSLFFYWAKTKNSILISVHKNSVHIGLQRNFRHLQISFTNSQIFFRRLLSFA